MNKKKLEKIKKIASQFTVIDFVGITVFLIILIVLVLFFLRKSSFAYVTLLVSKDKYAFNSLYYYKPPSWYLQNLKVGMVNKDFIGKPDLEIVDIYSYPNINDENQLYVTLKVKTVFNKRTQQHLYQGQPLLIGENRSFKLDSIYIPGDIHKISNQLDEEKNVKKIIVTGELEGKNHEKIPNFNDAEIITNDILYLGIKKYLADKIESGLTITNSKNEMIAKVIDVEKSSGYREFAYGASFLKSIDQSRQIVKLKVEVNLQKVNGKYLYMETDQVLIGKMLQLPFKDFVVYLTVEKIENLD